MQYRPSMEKRPIVLVDLEATLDRHWFGLEPKLRGPIPAIEPPARRSDRELAVRQRVDHWAEPTRLIDVEVAAALLPYHRTGALVLMTAHPAEPRECTERRLAVAGFTGVPVHHVALGEHPAYGKRRIARAVRPAITVEGDLRIAEFLAAYGYETLLVDDRFNRGPIRSVNLMRIARRDLAKVLALRLEPDLAEEPEPEFQLDLAPA
jgi:hypothetical protein